jgi:hypothetical protein
MHISTINSPPLTPPASSSALVQAGKVEQSANNSLQGASSFVIPSISAGSQRASQIALNNIGPAVSVAVLNFSSNGEGAHSVKG